MAFSSGEIDVKTVCEAYGVTTAPYSMSALQGKKYYQSPSPTAITVPVTGPVSLDIFKGSYANLPVITSLISGTPSIGYFRVTPIYFSGTGGPYASVDYTIKYKTTFGVITSIYIGGGASPSLSYGAYTGSGSDVFYNYCGLICSGCGADMNNAIYNSANFTNITLYGSTKIFSNVPN